MFFDSHAHLDDEQFDHCREDVIDRATAAGVTEIVTVGTTAPASRKCVDLAVKYPSVHASVGIQPNYCQDAKAGDWDEVVRLAEMDGVVAVGETGLDRHWDYSPLDVQRDFFDRHIRLSQATALPFIVHMRDCGEDIIEMLRDARVRGPLAGVMHSYTGNSALAAECIELGLYISFAGMVTFKKSQELREVAKEIPNDRILIETDSPYLSPHPKRGRRPNEPALIVHTAACLADHRDTTLAEFARTTRVNAKQLFRI